MFYEIPIPKKQKNGPLPSGSVFGDGLLSRAPSLVCARVSTTGGRCGNCCDCGRAMATTEEVGEQPLVTCGYAWTMPGFRLVTLVWSININEFDSTFVRETMLYMLVQTLHCLTEDDMFILAGVSVEVVVNHLQDIVKLLCSWYGHRIFLVTDWSKNGSGKSRSKGLCFGDGSCKASIAEIAGLPKWINQFAISTTQEESQSLFFSTRQQGWHCETFNAVK